MGWGQPGEQTAFRPLLGVSLAESSPAMAGGLPRAELARFMRREELADPKNQSPPQAGNVLYFAVYNAHPRFLPKLSGEKTPFVLISFFISFMCRKQCNS